MCTVLPANIMRDELQLYASPHLQTWQTYKVYTMPNP